MLTGDRHIAHTQHQTHPLTLSPFCAIGPILLVARGSSAVPVFEKVQVSDLDPSSFPLIISLQPSPSSGLMSNAPQGQGQGQGSKATHSISDVTILGPESLMGARPATMARGVAADAGPSRKRAEPDDEPPPSSHATQEEGERINVARVRYEMAPGLNSHPI